MFMKHGIVAGVALAVSLATPAMARVDGDTITLGSSISLTGKYATNGLHTQRGYDYAVKVINEAGGVKVGGKSYKLAVKYYDDESTPARGAQLAERLIQQDGVEYMLGPYSSGMTKAIAPVSEKFGVPMVEAEGASRSLFTQGYKYLFAVLSTSEQYLATAIDFAADKSSDPKGVRLRGRPVLDGCSRRCDGQDQRVRHEGRHRRPASRRPVRYVYNPDQGEGAEA